MSSGSAIRVVHLSYDGIQSAFQSQTVGLVGALTAAGVWTGVIVFTQGRRPRGQPSPIGDPCVPFRAVSRPPFIGSANLILASRQVAPLIRELARSRPVVLHCRSHLGAAIGLRLRAACGPTRVCVVADIRGVVADEIEMLAGRRATAGRLRNSAARMLSKHRVAVVRRIESEICIQADAVVCVSEALKARLVEEHGIPQDRVTVVPTCTGFVPAWGEQLRQRRGAAKAKMGLEGKFVVAYCGSMHPWQEPGDIIRAFRACRAERSEAHLLLLTKLPDVARSALIAAEVPSDWYTILSLSHGEIQEHLAAADVGLLLRRQSPVNRAASPIKFAEYVACGVPVIASRGIGDLDDLIPAYGVGVLVDDPAKIGGILAAVHLDERGAQRMLDEDYSWAGAVCKLLAVYARARQGRTAVSA